jgi:multidrug efflux pump subunit AcrB
MARIRAFVFICTAMNGARSHLAAVAAQLAGAVRGFPGSLLRVQNEDGLAVWIQLLAGDRQRVNQLATYPVVTPTGSVPLAGLGTLKNRPTASIITRQGLERTLDVQAYRTKQPISRLQEDVDAALAGLDLRRAIACPNSILLDRLYYRSPAARHPPGCCSRRRAAGPG